jgi:hypothetical protein
LPPADAELIALTDELRDAVDHLSVEIGERNVLAKPHELADAANYIEEQFSSAGYVVRRQEYPVAGKTCCNLEVELIGDSLPREIVVVGAHYDSVLDCPAANDNGTGVAALLSLARRFSGRTADRTLRFVAFVNEEPPYFQTEEMGSWVYAKQCRKQNEAVTAMLSLETIGYYSDQPDTQQYPAPFGLLYPSTGNFVAFVGNIGSGDLVRQAVGSFRQHEPFPSEGGALPEFISGIGFSDHWSFRASRIRAARRARQIDNHFFQAPHHAGRSFEVNLVRGVFRGVVVRISEGRRVGDHQRRIALLREPLAGDRQALRTRGP